MVRQFVVILAFVVILISTASVLIWMARQRPLLQI